MARKINRDTKLGAASDSRRDRASEDREITEDRVMTDDERLDECRQTFFQSALPDLPDIPGYHVCWLTTENPRDPIHGRIRLERPQELVRVGGAIWSVTTQGEVVMEHRPV